MKTGLILIIIAVVLIGGGTVYWFWQKSSPSETATVETAAPTNETQTEEPTESLYVGEDFTLMQPLDWKQGHISGTLVSFHNTDEIHPEGSAAAKINFKSYIATAFENTEGRTLTEVDQLALDTLTTAIPSTAITHTDDETINGLPAKLSVLEFSQQDVDYTVLLVIMTGNDKFYTLSFNTTTEKWPEYNDMFYEVARSFELKE